MRGSASLLRGTVLALVVLALDDINRLHMSVYMQRIDGQATAKAWACRAKCKIIWDAAEAIAAERGLYPVDVEDRGDRLLDASLVSVGLGSASNRAAARQCVAEKGLHK